MKLTASEIKVRAMLCAKCPSPCASPKIEDATFGCPIKPRRFSRKTSKPSVGLGDAVAFFAQPIARAIDAVAGTNVRNCSKCHGTRKKKLNELVPDILHPLRGR